MFDESNSLSSDNVTTSNSLVSETQNVSLTNSFLPIRLPKLQIEKSKSSIKQEEPEADHDYLCNKALNHPFKSSRSHLTQAFKSFDLLRKQKVLCDVILRASENFINNNNSPVNTVSSDDESSSPESNFGDIYAHKIVLAACSPYFHAMFRGNMCESNARYVVIKQVSHESLVQLIDFIYTCEIHVDEQNVQSLLPAANILQLSEVTGACCDFLQYQLHPSNCLGIQRFADLHSCADLLAYSRAFTENHFREIMTQDEFLHLPVDSLEAIISSNSLCASEEEVFESVKRWILHDVTNRLSQLQRLFGHIRFALLSREFLLQLSTTSSIGLSTDDNSDDAVNGVDSDDLPRQQHQQEEDLAQLRNNQAYKDFLIEALRYQLLSPDEKKNLRFYNIHSNCNTNPESTFYMVSMLSNVQMSPRKPLVNSQRLLVIGGQAPKAIRSIEELDLHTQQWVISSQASSSSASLVAGSSSSQLTELPSRRCRCGAVVIGNVIYVIGGFNGSLRVRSLDMYDMTTERWHNNNNQMLYRRSTLGVAMLNGLIYAIGGFDGSQGLSSAERYDPSTNLWSEIDSMSTRRSSVGVGVWHGCIYAVGGYDGLQRECLASVERYNTTNAKWECVHPMSCRRSGAAVVALDGYVYVLGGHDGPNIRNSAERYCVKTAVWSNISSMNCARRNAGVVTHNGLIYIVGGDDGTMNLRSVEQYDPQTDIWSLLPNSMALGRSYSAVVLIPAYK